MSTPEEKKELELVERVDFRIITVANDEEKLQSLLQRYLAPLLLKAGSEHASVRAKVITACQRLKTFIQPPGVVLPVAALLDQFKATDSSVIRHLDLMFIQHSIGRLEPADRRDLFPIAAKGISKESSSTPIMFNILLQMLAVLQIPSRGSQEDGTFREDIGLSDPEDAKFLASWLAKLLLLKQTVADSPGLSEEDIKFLTLGKQDTWTAASGLGLFQTRIKALNVLASGAFTDEERFLPAVYAAANSDGRISSIGDDLLKRTTVSLEDKALVETLFEAHAKLPPTYRSRILGLLSKSAISTTYPEQVLNVVRTDVGLHEDDDTMDIDTDQMVSRPQKPTGLELTKLHKAVFEYINWVAKMGPAKGMFKLGGPLLEDLDRFIRGQGWPVPSSLSAEQATLRARAYETMGVLLETAKLSTQEKAALLGFLFRSLSEDPSPDIAQGIEGALSVMRRFYKPSLGIGEEIFIHSLILSHMATPSEAGDAVRSTRNAAVKCANNYLPFSDVTARWADILAVAGARDERSDVIEEGQKGLDPWTYYANDETSTDLPDWQEMARTFFDDKITPATHVPVAEQNTLSSTCFTNFTGDQLNAYPLAVKYCTRILFLTALKKEFKVEPGWERRLETAVRSDIKSRGTIQEFLKRARPQDLLKLLHASFEGMVLDRPQIAEDCARCFVDVASLAPKAALQDLTARIGELISLITSNKSELRGLGARAYGLLAAHPACPTELRLSGNARLAELTRSWKTAVGSDLNAAQGAFLAMAYMLSRSMYYSAPEFSAVSANAVAADVDTILPPPDELALASSPSFRDTIFEAMSQLWTAGIPCLPDEPNQVDIAASWADVLFAQAKKGNERAITAMGRFAIALDDDVPAEAGIIKSILAKLYELHEIKQAEAHFAIGEAITAAVACWSSEVIQLTLDVEPKNGQVRVGARPDLVAEVLNKLLQDCKTTKPSLLKASGIWLFCLIQHCSGLPEIQTKLRESQVAFMRLLSARDELVQETASRGLALVYEKGDAELRDALVKDLVSAFTGTGLQLKVDEETELFEAGALPTGEGKSVTSYKDIVSLANEVGDQSLIYKFMSLATNAATWSTRSAFGRFGLSNILSESEVDPKLYPKLYRYRFDPNTNVQKSMNDIWKALVKDSGAVINKHFDAIVTDLLKSVFGKEWRVREASCAAIAELIGGQKFPKYEKYYKDIWAAAVRVLDDVKATVREAALHLCMNLSNTLVRQLDEGGSTATARAMMGEALPFLLSEKGIDSSVQEVKAVTAITVIKICGKGGKALRPYIPVIVPHLLGLLATIEPEALNYWYQRAGEARREQIDKMRSSIVNQSPISVAIDDAVRSVDASVMPQLLDGVEQVVKGALGFQTKIGCGRLLSTLATRHGPAFAPHSARFLLLLERHALDRNDEVSQSYARAAAYVIRVAPDGAKLRYAEDLTGLYFASEDEVRRQKVADAVLFLSKVSQDHFNALEGRLLPLAFLASHDTDEYVEKAFREVWDKHAGSDRSVARYIPEMVALVRRSLDTAQWALKHAGALTAGAMVRAVTSASDLSGTANLPGLKAIYPIFDDALRLKTFPCKERLLEALADLAEKGKPLWAADAVVAANLEKAVLREAKRNNAAYRVHAFECLWKFARARTDLDMLDAIVGVVGPSLDELEHAGEEDRMEVDGKGDNKSSSSSGPPMPSREDLVGKTAANALEAVARGYSRPRMGEDPAGVLGKILEVLGPYLGSRHFDRVRRDVWYKCVADLMEETEKAKGSSGAGAGGGSSAGSGGGDSLIMGYFRSLDVSTPDVGTEDQRSARAGAALGLVRALNRGVFGATSEETGKTIDEALRKAVEAERSMDVRRVLRDGRMEVLGPQ